MAISLNGTAGITNVNGTAAAPAITGADTTAGMYFDTDTVALSTSGVAALTIDANSRVNINANTYVVGNVGIGIDNPSQKLEVIAGAGQTARMVVGGGDTAVLVINGDRDNTGDAGTEDCSLLFTADGNYNPSTNGGLGAFGFRIGCLNNLGTSQLTFTEVISGVNYERMRLDNSGNLQFNSGYGSSATAYGCRAWVNFNGTGTVAIRASGNVSSITDNGTGDYTVNFATAMPDANYNVTGTAPRNNANDTLILGPKGNASTYSTSAVRIAALSDGGAMEDSPIVSVSIFR
jgi:hypothetical protein